MTTPEKTPEIAELLEILEKKVQKMAEELLSLRTRYADLQSRLNLLEEENKQAQKILADYESSNQLKSQILNRLKKISEKLSSIN